MGLFSILPFALAMVLWQVEVSCTDRSPFQAQLLSLAADAIEIAEGSSESQIPLDKLRRLRMDTESVTDSGTASTAVTLTDGSICRYEHLTMDETKARITLAGGHAIEVAGRKVANLQLQTLNEPQQSQWETICQSRNPSDVLVLIRSAEVLEKLEGIVLGVTKEAVRFDFGGQTIDAPLGKLAGVCLFNPADANRELEKLSAIVHDRSGSRWMASQVSAARGSTAVELKLQCGADILLPLTDLRELDYSSGSVQFLADLQPLRTESRKRIDLSIGKLTSDSLFGPRRSEWDAPGAPALGPSLEFLGSGSSVYRVPAGFSRLVGSIELRPAGSRSTPCQVTVRLENKVIWQERLTETGKRVPLDLPIEADRRLLLDVEAEAVTPVGDVVLWHEIRLVK